MSESVKADLVTLTMDLPDDVGVARDSRAHHEKGRRYVVGSQDRKDFGRPYGVRSVFEAEHNGLIRNANGLCRIVATNDDRPAVDYFFGNLVVVRRRQRLFVCAEVTFDESVYSEKAEEHSEERHHESSFDVAAHDGYPSGARLVVVGGLVVVGVDVVVVGALVVVVAFAAAAGDAIVVVGLAVVFVVGGIVVAVRGAFVVVGATDVVGRVFTKVTGPVALCESTIGLPAGSGRTPRTKVGGSPVTL